VEFDTPLADAQISALASPLYAGAAAIHSRARVMSRQIVSPAMLPSPLRKVNQSAAVTKQLQ